MFLLFTALYLLSFAVSVGWVLLLVVGFVSPAVMAVAKAIAVPTILASVLCTQLFKRLARGAERKLS
jgi:hypothetical protein